LRARAGRMRRAACANYFDTRAPGRPARSLLRAGPSAPRGGTGAGCERWKQEGCLEFARDSTRAAAVRGDRADSRLCACWTIELSQALPQLGACRRARAAWPYLVRRTKVAPWAFWMEALARVPRGLRNRRSLAARSSSATWQMTCCNDFTEPGACSWGACGRRRGAGISHCADAELERGGDLHTGSARLAAPAACLRSFAA
jgi:hypothetical protein